METITQNDLYLIKTFTFLLSVRFKCAQFFLAISLTLSSTIKLSVCHNYDSITVRTKAFKPIKSFPIQFQDGNTAVWVAANQDSQESQAPPGFLIWQCFLSRQEQMLLFSSAVARDHPPSSLYSRTEFHPSPCEAAVRCLHVDRDI